MTRHPNLRDITLAVMPEKRPDSDICAVVTQIKRAQDYTTSRLRGYPTANDISRYGSMLRKPTASEELLKNLGQAVLLGLAVNENMHYSLTPQGLDLCTPKGSDCPFAIMTPKERKKVGENLARTIRLTKISMYGESHDGTIYRHGRPVLEKKSKGF